MENKAKFPEYTFEHAKARFEQLTPTRIPHDEFIEKAYITWRDLPDRHTIAHIYTEQIDMNNRLELPDNVEYIKAVVTPGFAYDMIKDRYSRIFIYYNGSKPYSNIKDEYPWESYRANKSIEDRYGNNITFDYVDDGVIEFRQEDMQGMYVSVLYKGLLVDENCDPLLYNNEINAIAANVAYLDTLYWAQAGDVNKTKMLSFMENRAITAMAKAGIAEKVTENDMDQLLDIKTSMGRKYYNRQYKFRH